MENQFIITSEEQILQLQGRIEAGEDVSEEELHAALDFCRNRAAKRATEKKKETATAKKAAAAVPQLDLNAMFAQMAAKKAGEQNGGA